MRVMIVMSGALTFLGADAAADHTSYGREPSATVDRVVINDNRAPAGEPASGTLTIRLVAREGEWHPDGDADPGITVHAFAEEGKALRVPGPLIRVSEGTEIHAFVRNALRDSTLLVYGLSPRGSALSASVDTIQVRPGATREVRFTAGAPGTYYYWGTTAAGGVARRPYIDGELNGAFVIDPRGTVGPPHDRVFVLALWSKAPAPAGVVARNDLIRFTINGKAWPHTERLAYSLGDTVRFRVVNTSNPAHPMHLHGFYFNVDSRGDGMRDTTYDRHGSPHFVVTERLAVGRTMSMTWVPDRPGNWLFHCHDNFHVLRNQPLDGTALPAEQDVHPHNHAVEMMGGLVMGIEVRPKGTSALGASSAAEGVPRRNLRLVARVDVGGTAGEPAYGYVLEDGTKRMPSSGPLLPGPTILLKRGEAVSITVVNELPEPTAVHWHGIELESYYDGVADFSGGAGRITPAIAPRDSFEARFTPPRAGTFMYHPHADELRQQQAGLSGALVVLDSAETFNPEKDIVLLVSVPRRDADRDHVLLNGSLTPAARELRVGERYRLRLINIHPYRPSMTVRLTRDSTLVTWRAIAKDGRELPPDQATMRPAMQVIGNGEAYDFELAPDAPGDLRLTAWSFIGGLLVSMLIHVR